jgi:ATP dependent DNA ligase-like protein
LLARQNKCRDQTRRESARPPEKAKAATSAALSDRNPIRQICAGQGDSLGDGVDLRGAPLPERKRPLAQLLVDVPVGRIRLSEHIEFEGEKVFEHACALHLEGIICKARDAPYRSGGQEGWIKVKCTKSGTYLIVAFVEKLGARTCRVASLYLGRRDGDRLLYAGKARSGYTETTRRALRERLDPFIRSTSPLSVPVKKPKATWVDPELSAEVQYSALTSDGLLREPVFKGIRDDLASPPAKSPASAADICWSRLNPRRRTEREYPSVTAGSCRANESAAFRVWAEKSPSAH